MFWVSQNQCFEVCIKHWKPIDLWAFQPYLVGFPALFGVWAFQPCSVDFPALFVRCQQGCLGLSSPFELVVVSPYHLAFGRVANLFFWRNSLRFNLKPWGLAAAGAWTFCTSWWWCWQLCVELLLLYFSWLCQPSSPWSFQLHSTVCIWVKHLLPFLANEPACVLSVLWNTSAGHS